MDNLWMRAHARFGLLSFIDWIIRAFQFSPGALTSTGSIYLTQSLRMQRSRRRWRKKHTTDDFLRNNRPPLDHFNKFECATFRFAWILVIFLGLNAVILTHIHVHSEWIEIIQNDGESCEREGREVREMEKMEKYWEKKRIILTHICISMR